MQDMRSKQIRVPVPQRPSMGRGWKRKDFELLKKKGKRRKQGGFFLVYRANQLSHSRFVFFFPRWTGKAVQRNRFKRWSRHFLRNKKRAFNMDLMMGFEKRDKHFYQRMSYEKFCAGFEKLYICIR